MTESVEILTAEYLDWHTKLIGLPSILTDKIRSKLYKRYKKQTGNEPWQLSEAVISISEKPGSIGTPQASDFKPITFEARPDPELIIKSKDEEQDDEVVTKVTPDQNNVLEVLPLAKLTSTTSIPLAHDSAKRLNGNSSDNSSKLDPANSPKAEASTSSTTSSSQINESNQSRLPISILPEDPEEKRKHIIGLVLEKFPYLSLDDSDERRDTFNLDTSALCPLCNGDHKVNRSIFDGIKGEWGAGEYYGERTYRLNCRDAFNRGIPIVSVKA